MKVKSKRKMRKTNKKDFLSRAMRWPRKSEEEGMESINKKTEVSARSPNLK